MTEAPKVLFFDVFGTVVEWRTPVVEELRIAADTIGAPSPGGAAADAWRAAYYGGIADIRHGRRAWTTIDHVLRDALDDVCESYGMATLTPRRRDELALAWQRLVPWPDAVDGLAALSRRCPVCALSNGNVGLVVALSRFAGLRWDAVFGPDVLGAYKSDEHAYLGAATCMRVAPGEAMMVATHARDIRAARSFGLRTAYVRRPDELGPGVDKEAPGPETEIVCDSLAALA